MALTEQLDSVNSIQVIADGSLEIREATLVLRDGVVDPGFSPKYHRYVLHPGDDLTGRDARIVAIAQATWTPDVIAAWKTAQESIEASGELD